MALPSGVLFKTVTFGQYLDAEGNVDASGRLTIIPADGVELFWTQGGATDVIEPISLTKSPDPFGRGQFILPVSDQPGFVTASGQQIPTFRYKASWSGFKFSKSDLFFQVLTSDPSVIDLESKRQGSTAPPLVNANTYVNSITIGGVALTGAVDLSSIVVQGNGTSTVAGLTDATPIGKSMMLAADASSVKNLLGLVNVNNTSDLNKPISAATQAALDTKPDTVAVTTALNLKSSVAYVDAQVATRLAASAPITLTAHDQSGSFTSRPITNATTPVIWICFNGVAPAGGGTVTGQTGMVTGLDVVLLSP
jgi:hypothetical protein